MKPVYDWRGCCRCDAHRGRPEDTEHPHLWECPGCGEYICSDCAGADRCLCSECVAKSSAGVD